MKHLELAGLLKDRKEYFMIIEHFKENISIDNIEELDSVLRIKAEGNVNEFWINNDRDYPCMCISTNGDYAHVHYFGNEGELGFQTIGNLKLDKEIYTFYTNNNSEIIEVPSEYVVDINTAIELAKEFFVSNELPKEIEWDEL